MDYKDSAKIVEIENEIKQLKADITRLQQENKEIRQIVSTFINQSAVELNQIYTQKEKDDATLTQHGLSAGSTSQTPNGASELARLQFNAIHTQQNSSSHRRNDGGHSTLLARAIADISAEQENGQSHSSDRERNRVESRSETMGKGTEEISRQARSIRKIYNYENQLNNTELKECEETITEIKKRQWNNKYPNLERKLNNHLAELISKKNISYASSLPKLAKDIAKSILTIERLGYQVSQNNTKGSIEIFQQCDQQKVR